MGIISDIGLWKNWFANRYKVWPDRKEELKFVNQLLEVCDKKLWGEESG